MTAHTRRAQPEMLVGCIVGEELYGPSRRLGVRRSEIEWSRLFAPAVPRSVFRAAHTFRAQTTCHIDGRGAAAGAGRRD